MPCASSCPRSQDEAAAGIVSPLPGGETKTSADGELLIRGALQEAEWE